MLGWCAQQGVALEYRMLGPDLVRVAVARGNRARAQDVAAAVAELADETRRFRPLLVLRCGAGDSRRTTPKILQAAVSAYASPSRPLEFALACEEAAAAFARQGMAEHARPLFDEAVGIYERLDAARDLARAEAVMREAGIRRGQRGPRSRPQIGWRSLRPHSDRARRRRARGRRAVQPADR
jgi:hypothetical protein